MIYCILLLIFVLTATIYLLVKKRHKSLYFATVIVVLFLRMVSIVIFTLSTYYPSVAMYETLYIPYNTFTSVEYIFVLALMILVLYQHRKELIED